MEILIFLVVIVVLIVVHEVGHLIVAKLSGMRVDEFGLGYPPRAALLGRIGETEITLNWLPFGGFVRIFGEDMGSQQQTDDRKQEPDPRAFGARPRILQALVLVAGVAMNLLFAYLLLTSALASGTPRALSDSQLASAKDVQLAVAQVLPGSPAASAGIQPGDTIASASDAKGNWSPSAVQGANASISQGFTNFVAGSGGAPMALVVDRSGRQLALTASARQDVVTAEPSRYALGLAIAPIGILPLSLMQSVTQGATLTWAVTKATAVGLAHFFYGLFTLHADLAQVTGPVGIAGAVGAAAHTGWGDLLSIAALISINLALINLVPIPALDGGRLLFVIIESITRRPIKPAIANSINSISFALLVLLMVVVTLHDIYKIVG